LPTKLTDHCTLNIGLDASGGGGGGGGRYFVQDFLIGFRSLQNLVLGGDSSPQSPRGYATVAPCDSSIPHSSISVTALSSLPPAPPICRPLCNRVYTQHVSVVILIDTASIARSKYFDFRPHYFFSMLPLPLMEESCDTDY
jgi:hypothetical protein